jgi:hypothetical protein
MVMKIWIQRQGTYSKLVNPNYTVLTSSEESHRNFRSRDTEFALQIVIEVLKTLKKK